MKTQDIQLLYKYNTWANKRILDAASHLTVEQFIAPASFPQGGLRGTLTHILFAEWIWRKRWEGESPSVKIQPEDFPTLAALRIRWQEEETALLSFIHSLNGEQLNKTFPYKTANGEIQENMLWEAMTHVVNHGTQHRSEAAAILTSLGHSPGDLDLIVFLRNKS
jgi:uncharacterized damage-inducible protein DinB